MLPSRPTSSVLPLHATAPSLLSEKRQGTTSDAAEVADAQEQCQKFVGNDKMSCWPTENTTLIQGESAAFVWNSRRPELAQDNRVNIYLFHNDSTDSQPVLTFENLSNNPSSFGIFVGLIDDQWWGVRGANFNVTATTYPFYWIISPSTKGLDGSQETQSIFNAVQTALPNIVISALSTRTSLSSATSSTANPSKNGTSQRIGGSVIAGIIVGCVLLCGLVLMFLFLRIKLRRRSQWRSGSIPRATVYVEDTRQATKPKKNRSVEEVIERQNQRNSDDSTSERQDSSTITSIAPPAYSDIVVVDGRRRSV